MALLEQHPPHIRKRIALFWTLGVGVVLVAILVILYSKKEGEEHTQKSSRLNDFYETISEETQSFFGGE